MKEFNLSVAMDRMPALNWLPEDQQRDVDKDTKILKELHHGLKCGCATCRGHALHVRQGLRGDLPIDIATGFPIDPFKKRG